MEIRVLGPVEAVVAGRLVPLAGAKPRLVLAALALRGGGTVPAERLIDELWGDAPPESATNTLQGYVSTLRKALGADAIERRTGGYALTVEPDSVDAIRFERLVAAAAAAEPVRAAALLRDALALWRGEPELDALRLGELRLAALEQRIDADLALGHGPELVSELEPLVHEHPLRERLAGQLMLALYRSDRQAEALEIYRRARTRLHDELGLDPSPALQELERSILRQDAALDAVTQSVRFVPPLPATPIVGRAEELERAQALLDDGARLVTFTGPGGIGKTRLALEVARERAPALANGALFVGLETVDDPALVAPTILRALDVRAEANLVAELHDRELLLLLDNFEQLLDAASLLPELLAAAPQLTILVTSRRLLRVAGEHELPVPPLDEAAELFFARAQAVAPGLDLDAHTQTVDAICERLDGLPLAIELAAARARLLPPAALLDRLASRLDLLTSGARDAPERQRTVRATIDWSYRLLEPAEQVLFARLGVFIGGASMQAAEIVCGEIATLDALGALVDSSLLQQRGETEPRFVMLETLREYALEQLAATGETTVLQQRHREFFLGFVRELEPALVGPDSASIGTRLDTESGNLRAAIGSAVADGDGATAAGIAGALRHYWRMRGHVDEGVRILETVADAFPDAPLRDRSRVLNGAGIMRGERGEYAEARVRFEQALSVARELGEARIVAGTLLNLGNIVLSEGEVETARTLYADALELMRAGDHREGEVTALENLGMVEMLHGTPEHAVGLFEQALESARAAQAPERVASASLSLGRALILCGELARGAALVVSALRGLRELGDRPTSAEGLEAFARLAAIEGRASDAAALLGAAAALRDSLGVVRDVEARRWCDETLTLLRPVLGDRLERELERGRALTEPAALALCVSTGAVTEAPA